MFCVPTMRVKPGGWSEGSDGNPDLNGPPEPLIYPDVHSIVVHASSSDLVMAPTGGGFYRSRRRRRRPGNSSTIAIVGPAGSTQRDPQHIVLGPADGVDRNGRVESTVDGGRTWSPASTGLKVPWPNTMVERFTQVGDELVAVLSNGELFSTSVSRMEWGRILPTVTGVVRGRRVCGLSALAHGAYRLSSLIILLP